MTDIQLVIHLDKETLDKVDDEVIKQGKNRTSGRRFNRSAFIEYAIKEYLKLPSVTRFLVGQTHKDFQRNK
jgi:hypothetical protein